jgi:hypothetical protein
MKIRSIQIIIVSFLFVLLFSLTGNTSDDAMKIAVASTGQEKNSAISQQAGRAPFFLFFDDRGNFFETVANPANDKSRNAGPRAASFLADKTTPPFWIGILTTSDNQKQDGNVFIF